MSITQSVPQIRWFTWLPALSIAALVPIAQFALIGRIDPHIIGATNDCAIVIILLLLLPMAVIWGMMEHRLDLWEQMAKVVLLGFTTEILSWVLQRMYYGVWRVGSALLHCSDPDLKNSAKCVEINQMLAWSWIPGSLQWSAVISMICIASPVLAHYMPQRWFVNSVIASTIVWMALLQTFMVLT